MTATQALAAPGSVPEELVPTLCRLVAVRRETPETSTFVVDATGQPGFHPGQVAMIGVLGVGECAISIDSDPHDSPEWEFTIRRVGVVTGALHDLPVGAQVTIRGPYGHGWQDPPDGADLLLVGGGIGLAPLRPAILRAMRRRDRLGRVVLAAGARTPGELLFIDELVGWAARHDVDVRVTVDSADGHPRWRGPTGRVTTLLDTAIVAPGRTHAMTCGPEVMLRAVGRDLVARGIPAHQVQVALERNMTCAVGTCGHCQLGSVFVCRDGPIVGLDRIGPELEVVQR